MNLDIRSNSCHCHPSLVKARTAQANQIRGLLSGLDIIMSQGERGDSKAGQKQIYSVLRGKDKYTNKTIKSEYTLEFKQDAARLVNEKGYTHQQLEGHLGISLSAICRWSRVERGPAIASLGKKSALSLTDLIRLR